MRTLLCKVIHSFEGLAASGGRLWASTRSLIVRLCCVRLLHLFGLLFSFSGALDVFGVPLFFLLGPLLEGASLFYFCFCFSAVFVPLV